MDRRGRRGTGPPPLFHDQGGRRARRGPQRHAHRRRRSTRHRRGPRLVRSARLPGRRAPRRRGPRVARARRAPRCCRRACRGRRSRITVNLAPGGVRKTGSGLELAVALGVLGANERAPRRRARRRRGARASSASTARCARCRAPSRSSTRWRAPGVGVRRRARSPTRPRPSSSAACGCVRRARSASCGRA